LTSIIFPSAILCHTPLTIHAYTYTCMCTHKKYFSN